MSKPSVLSLVSYRVFPALMGGQKCVVDFYEHLSDHANVLLAVSKDNEKDTHTKYRVEPFLFNHWAGDFNLIYIFRLLKLMKKHQVEYIIIEHSYFGWLGLILRFFSKKKLILRMHNIEGHRFRDMQRFWWWGYLIYEKWVCKKADQLWFTASTDFLFATKEWKIKPEKCSTLFYGIENKEIPTVIDKQLCRNSIIEKHGLNNSTKLFLFNGTLDYVPNTDALRIIVHELLPRLAKKIIGFRIIICGNRITDEWQEELTQYPEIIFEGFVPDISVYFKGCDCFINPVTLGSGLKTKLVEALAYNIDIISVESSTQAIDSQYSEKKVLLIEDYNWDAFVDAMYHHQNDSKLDTPTAFYEAFNWQHIIQKAVLSLQNL
jgi:glycosyltransferase involved in cell wall biosynthesis